MIYENDRFTVEVGVIGEDKDPQYLVRSKAYGVVEFCNTSLYFVRDWAQQMSKALEQQDWEIANPGKPFPENNVIPFPGGKGGGRAN